MTPSDPLPPPPPQYNNIVKRSIAGAFITLTNADFTSHLHALREHKLTFSTTLYPDFDGELAKAYPNAALTDANHISYAQYQPLRKNIAVLRNYIFTCYFEEENTAMEGAALPYIRTIASTLGEALKRGSNVLRNPFEPALTIKETNALGYGGSVIYQLLQQLQMHAPQPKSLRKSPHALARLPHPSFTLPPLSASPFSKLQPDDTSDNVKMRSEQEAVATQAILDQGGILTQQAQNKLNAINISNLSDEIIALRQSTGTKTKSVEDMDDRTKTRAIELGRDILRKLKLHFADMSVENLMKSNPADVQTLMGDVKKVTDLFRYYLDQLDQKQRDLLEHPDVINALKASGTLAAAAKLYAINEAKKAGDKELAERLAKEYEKMPEEWRNTQTTKIGDLFENLDKGLKILQYHLLNQTSNLPDNDQLKDIGGDNAIPQQNMNGLTLAQANVEQTEQMRVQMEMLQQEAYRNMLAERRKANQAAQMISGGSNTQNNATPATAPQTQQPNAAALDTPRPATTTQQTNTRRNLNAQQLQQERRETARQQQGNNPLAQNNQRSRRSGTNIEQRDGIRPEQQPTTAPKTKQSNTSFDGILDTNDMRSIRNSLSSPTTGTLIETNTTKKVIEDRLKEGSQSSTSLASPTPPPRPPVENPLDDPNNPSPYNKKSYTR